MQTIMVIYGFLGPISFITPLIVIGIIALFYSLYLDKKEQKEQKEQKDQ